MNKIGEDKKPSKHLVLSDVNEVKCFDSASAQQEKGFTFVVSAEDRLF